MMLPFKVFGIAVTLFGLTFGLNTEFDSDWGKGELIVMDQGKIEVCYYGTHKDIHGVTHKVKKGAYHCHQYERQWINTKNGKMPIYKEVKQKDGKS